MSQSLCITLKGHSRAPKTLDPAVLCLRGEALKNVNHNMVCCKCQSNLHLDHLLWGLKCAKLQVQLMPFFFLYVVLSKLMDGMSLHR